MAKDAKGHGSEKRGVSGAGRAPDFGARAVESPTPNKPSGIFKPGTAPSLGDQIRNAQTQRAEGAAAGMSADALVANTLGGGHPKSGTVPAHPGTAGRGGVTIFHQDGEYAVPNGAKNKHYFTNDKKDAEDTARHIHGQGISIKHRSKRWGPEMD